jgi:predicted transcriptional regulator
LRLDSERRWKLQKIADDHDRDMAYIIRKAIDEYIKHHEEAASA